MYIKDMLPLYVVNNYGQFNHLIHRMIRDLEIEVRMIPNTTPANEVRNQCRGIILGGGPSMERTGNCAEYLHLDIPVLGICLGHQLIALEFGGEIGPGTAGGYGSVDVDILRHGQLLSGYPERIHVWASHADEVKHLPDGFEILAASSICQIEAIASEDKRMYGLQWHPEVSHSKDGHLIYENFNRICME
ncbi:GMP synthase (glutamine-hydrolyzing) [Methanocalculus sp. AMF5]|nr:GMP synthase (glutamine-hydrolyzing) [Methanocalculus sp. AMF5]